MSTTYSFEKHHDVTEVHDEDGLVATFGIEVSTGCWWVQSDPDRFERLDSLPPCFGGKFHRWFKKLGDVYRMFGVPLPGDAAIEQRSAAA